MKQLISLTFITLLLTACGEEAKSVEYYSKNLEEAKAVRKHCDKESATLTENCKNASKALLDSSYEKALTSGISY
ncbi:EexN family lipoprotein [Vibrio jasicida]|uniref:EexN family lipoprotein n=1 Tax=Vibrio jasicida TaxID=766224 RepID=A0ABW7J301_9VIBR